MRYFVPEMTLTGISDFLHEVALMVPCDEMILDFSHVNDLDPLSMLMTGAAIRSYKEMHPDVSFKISGLKTDGDFNDIPITQIEVEKLKKAAYEQGIFLVTGELIEKEADHLSERIDGKDKELHKLLTFLMREMMRNVPEHAMADTMWVCGRYCPEEKMAEFAVQDQGIGIFNSLTGNAAHREYVTDNAAALQWALKAGISKSFRPSMKQISRDEWANSGFGLYMISEICRYLKGSFCIVSGGGYLFMDARGVKTGEIPLEGTAVKIQVPWKKTTDAQTIISQTALQGETEAGMVRNAFKTASKPSRGLMESLHIQSSNM